MKSTAFRVAETGAGVSLEPLGGEFDGSRITGPVGFGGLRRMHGHLNKAVFSTKPRSFLRFWGFCRFGDVLRDLPNANRSPPPPPPPNSAQNSIDFDSLILISLLKPYEKTHGLTPLLQCQSPMESELSRPKARDPMN